LDQGDRPRQQAAKKRVSWGTHVTIHPIPARPRTPEDAGLSADALAKALTEVLASQGAAAEGSDERPTRRGARKTVSWATHANIRSIPARSSRKASPHQGVEMAATVAGVEGDARDAGAGEVTRHAGVEVVEGAAGEAGDAGHEVDVGVEGGARAAILSRMRVADARAARAEDVCVEGEIIRAPEGDITAELEARLSAFVLCETRRLHK